MDTDLVIIGAGPAGGVLALTAAQAGFRVTLVDSGAGPDKSFKDTRNYAIVLGSWRLLSGLGLGRKLDPVSEALHGLQAEDGTGGSGHVLFADEDLKLSEDDETLGRMIEAETLTAVISDAVAAQDGIRLVSPARYRSHTADASGVTVRIEGADDIRAPLLVGCDGVESRVREAAGIRTIGWDYDQAVFAANVELDAPHGGIARQWFTPEGPFATLPLQGQRANLAWYMRRRSAEALAELSNEQIEAELNHRFAHLAGTMRLEGDHLTYPLKLKVAEKLTGERVAIVGDAARRISPIAGQGLNSGLKDAAALVEVMEEARAAGLDWGSPVFLEKYERWRRFDSVGVALAMDAMSRGFGGRNPLLRPMRSMALNLADRLSPLRRWLVGQASANQPDLPKRMQPGQG